MFSDWDWVRLGREGARNGVGPSAPPTNRFFWGATIAMTLLSSILAGIALAFGPPAEFRPPVRLMADGVPVRVEAPGCAAPCWVDFDGDGKKDLLVGQFSGGKVRVYKNLGDGKLAAGQWLQADGEVAKVPGVW